MEKNKILIGVIIFLLLVIAGGFFYIFLTQKNLSEKPSETSSEKSLETITPEVQFINESPYGEPPGPSDIEQPH